MQFSKIGITKKGLIEISYLNGAAFIDQNTRKMGEPALPSFGNVLQDLASDMVNICELPHFPDLHDHLFIRSVNFKFHEDFGDGISITAERLLDNGKTYSITSPIFWSEGKHSLRVLTVRKIDNLRKEAQRYLKGERLQGRLDLEGRNALAKKADDPVLVDLAERMVKQFGSEDEAIKVVNALSSQHSDSEEADDRDLADIAETMRSEFGATVEVVEPEKENPADGEAKSDKEVHHEE